MNRVPPLPAGQAPVIAALHLPPFPASPAPRTFGMPEIIAFTLRNIERAWRAGVSAVYLQDVGDRPVAPQPQPHTIAAMTAVAAAVRAAFPDLVLGISLMGNAAQPPLAIAQAVGAHFVRFKVYVGVMVKPEGLVPGCAYEAVQYRKQCGMEDMIILADIYDRTGEPLGRMPVGETARQAVQLGRADGLVLTGASEDESFEMLAEVRQRSLGAPLFLGGGATPENCAHALRLADGLIVSTTFTAGQRVSQGMPAEWDAQRIQRFMECVARDA